MFAQLMSGAVVRRSNNGTHSYRRKIGNVIQFQPIPTVHVPHQSPTELHKGSAHQSTPGISHLVAV